MNKGFQAEKHFKYNGKGYLLHKTLLPQKNRQTALRAKFTGQT